MNGDANILSHTQSTSLGISLHHSCSYPANQVAAPQFKTLYRYSSGASVILHMKHQNGEKCDFSVIVGARWAGLSISETVDLLLHNSLWSVFRMMQKTKNSSADGDALFMKDIRGEWSTL